MARTQLRAVEQEVDNPETEFGEDMNEAMAAAVSETPAPQPVAVPASRIEQARAWFTKQVNELMERKSEIERRIAGIGDVRGEREQKAKLAFNTEMAAAASDWALAMAGEEASLKEVTACKEAYDLALGRLNKG